MEPQTRLKTIYFNYLKRQKQKEQLEIGKIKFEMQPIYITKNQFISVTRLKYGTDNYDLIVSPIKFNIITVLLLALLITYVFSIFIYKYYTVNILSINTKVLVASMPYLFSGINADLYPYITSFVINGNFFIF